jgi:ABC-type transport system substrate-binding protein
MRSATADDFQDIVGADAYMAGRAAQIAGVVAHGSTFTIRLRAPAPDLVARLTEPAMCAVPSDTPVNPGGLAVIPSAGPYRVASYVPGQGAVLVRNPNYHGSRPHQFARIDVAVGIPGRRIIANVEAGKADYAEDGAVSESEAAALDARYGAASPAARHGRQQYFDVPYPMLGFLALNTHRALFADVRLRRAVNYAINREALARLGDEGTPLPEQVTDHYLPPGVPGYRNLDLYPNAPDLPEARRLGAGHAGATAVLYTCDTSPCDQQAQIITNDLGAIGIRVQVRALPESTLYTELAKPGEPFDIATVGWMPSYRDPFAMLNVLLATNEVIPRLDDATYQARLAAAAKLSGVQRYLTYGRLDADLARNAAPWVAYGNASYHELFAARIGCQTYGAYGVDLAALCIRNR